MAFRFLWVTAPVCNILRLPNFRVSCDEFRPEDVLHVVELTDALISFGNQDSSIFFETEFGLSHLTAG